MNKKIISFSGKYFTEILNGKIQNNKLIISASFFEFLSKWIIKNKDYFCFDMYKSNFYTQNNIWFDANQAMYDEYINNKTCISDFFNKKPSLRAMVVLWKTIVDAFALQVEEAYPNDDIVVFCMINKQRSSDVWLSMYKYRENCSPILEPYNDGYENNSYYLKRIWKK